MPTTTHEKLFLAYSLIFGILAGVCISVGLQAIALPSTSGLLLTVQEQLDITILSGQVGRVYSFITIGLSGALVYLLLLLPILNPNINVALLKQPKKLLRLAVYITVALVVTVGLSVRLGSFFGTMNDSLFIRIAGAAVPVIWWSILGEIGIAGDFSTWKPKHQTDLRTCTFLAITTYFIFTILTLADNWGFLWFFTLVSEVISGPGEISIQGYTWLRTGLIVLSTCTSVTLATAVIALAPRKRELYDRTNRLVLPMGLTIGFTLLLSGGYLYGTSQYDLGSTNPAQALGDVTPAPTETIHTATLQGDSITSALWHSEITVFSTTGNSKLPASLQQIQAIEEYLASQPQSVHRAAMEDAVVKIAFNLWDADLATEHQRQVQATVLQRLVWLNRMSCLTITPENSAFLEQYQDDSIWWVGHKAALRLASAAIHFNDFDQARRWLELAEEHGASQFALAKVSIPDHPLLTEGKIAGTIKTDRPVVIALLRAGEDDRKIYLDTNFMSLNLVASQTVQQNGDFGFTNIGAGRYFIAMRYAGEPAQITMAEQDVLLLDQLQPEIDLGTINLIAR